MIFVTCEYPIRDFYDTLGNAYEDAPSEESLFRILGNFMADRTQRIIRTFFEDANEHLECEDNMLKHFVWN